MTNESEPTAEVFVRDFDALWRDVRAAVDRKVATRNAVAGDLVVEWSSANPDQVVVVKVTVPAAMMIVEPSRSAHCCWLIFQRRPGERGNDLVADYLPFIAQDGRLVMTWRDVVVTPDDFAQVAVRQFVEWV